MNVTSWQKSHKYIQNISNIFVWFVKIWRISRRRQLNTKIPWACETWNELFAFRILCWWVARNFWGSKVLSVSRYDNRCPISFCREVLHSILKIGECWCEGSRTAKFNLLMICLRNDSCSGQIEFAALTKEVNNNVSIKKNLIHSSQPNARASNPLRQHSLTIQYWRSCYG